MATKKTEVKAHVVDPCPNCGACRHHDICQCCGKCRNCGQFVNSRTWWYPPFTEVKWTVGPPYTFTWGSGYGITTTTSHRP